MLPREHQREEDADGRAQGLAQPGVRIAGFDAGQNARHFVHGRHQRGSIDLGARLT
jgi:hypothetical protein